jgi:hypothetical protein
MRRERGNSEGAASQDMNSVAEGHLIR